MHKLLKEHFFTKEFVKYVFVGGFGAIIDFTVFILLISFSNPIMISQWLAGIVAFSFTHIWHHYFIFSHNQKLKKTYLISLIINLTSIGLSGPLLLLMSLFLNIWLAKIIITAFFTIIVFVVRKKWVFIYK